ncbi:MAG: SUMF1/EgtB/PvdO family nonheme iron enzyme [Acidobacteriota bacterium]
METLEAKKCEKCDSMFDRSLTFCPQCGQRLILVDTIIGQTLDGRYKIETVLGRGGMGVVYRAMHVHLDARVAVKVLHPELVSNQSAIERFRREARAAGRIQHPNAIQVTDFGVSSQGVVYLVMEMVQGETLRDLLRREKVLDPERAIAMMRQVCAAVDAAHQGGVIHRDLKPDNIIVQEPAQTAALKQGEVVKVLDFGIAKLRERESPSDSQGLPDTPSRFEQTLTEAGMLIGTPQYMSPEQCRAKKLDSRSDIYSLGVILYEMLTGQLPFTGETPIEVVLKHIKEAPRPLREINPNIPWPVEEVVMRAMEKDPAARQASAAELSADLTASLTASGEIRVAASLPTMVGKPANLEPSVPSGDLSRMTVVQPRSQTDALGAISSPGLPAPPKPSGVVTQPPVDAASGSLFKTLRIPIIIGAVVLGVVLIVWVIQRNSGGEKVAGGQTGQPGQDNSFQGMVLIDGGEFTMGRNQGGRLYQGVNIEGPAHAVKVDSFYLDINEVTNRRYKEFVEAKQYPAPRHWKNNGSYEPEDAELPVTFVSWTDANNYATWKGRRLPTEKEWEYAARSGDRNYLYPWGNEYKAGFANVFQGGSRKERPAPVGTYKEDRNRFGVYDLTGNVSEWVQDFFRLYDNKPFEDLDKLKVLRGGHFTDPPETATASFRWADDQNKTDEATLSYTGFRCAKSVGRD